MNRFYTRMYGDYQRRNYGMPPVTFCKWYGNFYRTYNIQWLLRMRDHPAIALFRRQSQMQSCSPLFRARALNIAYFYQEPRRQLKL